MEASNPKKYHIKWLSDSAGNTGFSSSISHGYPSFNINQAHQTLGDFITQYPKGKGEVEECHCAGG